MALSIYLQNGKIVVKSLATVNAAYDPAYFAPIQAKQYPTEGFLTATRVGTTSNISITDANGKYIVYDLPYTQFKQKNGTTNIGTTVLNTVSALNGTSYFGFDVDFNSSITSIDTRVGGAETTLSDVGKALRYDKNSGADPRGIYYDDAKGTSNSLITIEAARAILQAGLVTQVSLYETAGLGYIDFSVLDGAGGSYTPVSILGRPTRSGILQLNSGTDLAFYDGTYISTVGLSSLTAHRSLILPDKDGTIALVSDLSANAGDITALDGRMTTAESEIDALQAATHVNSLNALTGAVTLSAGTHVTLTQVGNDIEISSSGGGGGGGGSDSFNTIAVPGQSDIVADSGNDTLNITAGNGIALTTTPASDTLTIAVDATTAEIPEDTNLYYTDTRVQEYLTAEKISASYPTLTLNGSTFLTSVHEQKMLLCDNGSGMTLQINTGMSKDAEILVYQAGTGAVTISAGSGVTINNTSLFLDITAEQYAIIGLKKLGASEVWVVTGERKLA
jgi:hypothetical protein